MDLGLLEEVSERFERIVTIEDGTVIGGLFGAVSEYFAGTGKTLPISPIAIEDRYLSQGTQNELREECNLTKERMKVIFEKEFKKISKKD